mgnify:CR=1 FL=1
MFPFPFLLPCYDYQLISFSNILLASKFLFIREAVRVLLHSGAKLNDRNNEVRGIEAFSDFVLREERKISDKKGEKEDKEEK